MKRSERQKDYEQAELLYRLNNSRAQKPILISQHIIASDTKKSAEDDGLTIPDFRETLQN